MADQGAVFRPAKKRARAATLFFRGSIVISALVATVNLWQFRLWGRMGGEIAVSPLEAEISDGASQLLAVVDVALFVGTGISFLTWFHRVRANLPALGIADARWSPGWAVGWWFVPIMSLFRPFQVAAEIWRASDPAATAVDWRERPLTPLLGWWWALFVFSTIAGQLSFRLSMRAGDNSTAEFMQSLALVDAASAAIDLVGAWLAIRVIAEIERRQTERSRLLAFT